ncbi:autotransporter domain-containing protein [Bradyrhizobium sp. ma5]|uniref:autotransporter domain-containing protein n=1 Tax=Bradyrhizobium sp. ma5 TaxID=3344828 RepID=UPI0035D4F2E6
MPEWGYARMRLQGWLAAAIILSVSLLAGPVLAQNGGVGGEGDYQSTGQYGGVGGVPGVNGGVGGDGGAPNRSCICTGGGGGGGAAGAAGGAGGPDGNLRSGGAGGAAGQDGIAGTPRADSASGGGGGGGGLSGTSSATLNNTGILSAGNGGKGGDGGVNASNPSAQVAGGGGGGGAGGTAFTITGAGMHSNSGSITGGNGGAGGAGDVGGSGGDGGAGIVVSASGATIRNSGSISGGTGGVGGAQVSDIYSNQGEPTTGGTRGRPGAAGTGGTGIVGGGWTIINSGTITGGGGPGAQGNAIGFTGGANTLTSIGGTLSGNLAIANGVGASLTFLQTSAAGASGDVTISGITGLDGLATDASVAVKLDGARSLIVTGASTYTGGTSVSDGSTLVIRNSNALGSGTLTMGETLAGLTKLVLDGNGFNIANTIVINSDPVITVAAGTTNTMSGAISGAGDIVLNGGGTLVLSGTNTYRGGTTICGTACGVAGGSSVLQVDVDTVGTPGAIVSSAIGTGLLTFDGGTLQAGGNYTIANNAQINAAGGSIDANGYTFTYSGNIAGTGGLLVLDASGGLGRVVLTGTNTYTGGTTICNCATLQLGDASHTASIVGEVVVDGKFDIVNANTAGITTIVNDGFNGVATTTFYNSTTASTATIINQNFGITEFRDNSTAGNASVSNSNSALTIFRDGSSAGNATFDNSSRGTVVFGDALGPPGGSDTSTAGKAVFNNHDGGGVVFLGHTNAGQATITNGNNGGSTQFFEFSSAASAMMTTSATGYIGFFQSSTAANATIDNSGLTYFGTSGGATEAPTAGNATITNRSGGALIFAAYATAGNATITTESGASVKFVDNTTGGTAQFITQGTGYVDFGSSLGPNGDGRITAGSIAGSGTYYIGGGNTLAVGGNNLSTVVSGVIADSNPCGCGPAGPGNLEKTGSGMLTLSGVNSYTGTTVVNGGILQVDGSIVSSSSVTVNSGGALSGIGTVGNTTIASGGILLPGNATPGTFLNVAGNLAFQSGALYVVGLNSTASTSAKVTGTATLAGSVGVSIAAGSTIARQYTILSAAGGRAGTFAGIDSTGVPSGLIATLGYDANHAYLNLALDYGAASKLNVNQGNVATTLQNFFNANGGINVVFAGLSPNGLTQASGEGAAGSQQATFNAMNQFLGLLTDPFVAGRDGGFGGGAGATPFAEESASLATAARTTEPRDALAAIYAKAPPQQLDFEQRWSIWAAGYGGAQTTNGNAVLGSNSTSSSVYGTAVGADYRFSPNTIAGLALAGGATSFSTNGLGWGRSDLFQAGAFVRHNVGAAYLSAALAYGWQDITTDRIVTAAGVDHLRANFNANAWSGRLEGGYRTATPWIGLTPYAAAQFNSFELPNYAESVVSGGGAFALNYAAKSVTDVGSELGLRSDKSFAVDGGIVTLRGRVAWAHDFNPNRSAAAVFEALPGAVFVVNGAAQASESALTTASAEIKWRNGWSAAATFEGEFSNVTRSYAGKGVMRYTW